MAGSAANSTGRSVVLEGAPVVIEERTKCARELLIRGEGSLACGSSTDIGFGSSATSKLARLDAVGLPFGLARQKFSTKNCI